MSWDEGQQDAKFNDGILKTQRVNEIQVIINECKLNPLAFNMQYNLWNFMLWFNSVCSLWFEIDAYPRKKGEKNDECDNILNQKEKIEKLLKDFPITERTKRGWTPVDEKRWEYIKQAIEKFELEVKAIGLKYKVTGALGREAGRI